MRTNPHWKKLTPGRQGKPKPPALTPTKEQLEQVAQAIWHNSPLLD
jgi:hypothetical protein